MARRTRSVFAKSNQGKLVGTVVNNMLASSERKAKQAKKDQARASKSNERARDREQKQREKARLKTEAKAARDSAKRLRDYAKQRDKEDKIRERIILELENNNIDLIPIMFLDVLTDQVEKAGLAINQIASGLIRPRIEKLKAESFEYFLRISLGMKPSQAELNSLISDFQDSPDIDAVFGDSRYQLLYVDYGREVFRNRYFNNVNGYANQAWYSALFDSEQIEELIYSDLDKVPENVGQKPGRLLSKEDWEKNYEQQYEEKHRFNYIPQDFIEFRQIADDKNLGDDQQEFWELEAKYHERCVLANIRINMLAEDSESLQNDLEEKEGIIDDEILGKYERARKNRQQFVSQLKEGLFKRPNNQQSESDWDKILGLEELVHLDALNEHFYPSTEQLEELILD